MVRVLIRVLIRVLVEMEKMTAKPIIKQRKQTSGRLHFHAAGEKEAGNECSSDAFSHPVFLLGSENVAGSQAMSSAQHAVIMPRK